MMRIEREVRFGGVTESGMMLFDRDNVGYHFITKRHSHVLFMALDNEWYKVRMNLSINSFGRNIVKNVRVVR